MSAVEELKLRRLLSMSNGSEVKNLHISSNGTGRIDLRPLKIMAANWPEPVRTLILTEPDELSAAEYMERQRIWSRLLAMRGDRQ